MVVKFHPPCCWVDSIDHIGETEHQTDEAGLKAEKYQLPGTIPQAKADKWTNRKVIKLSSSITTPKVAMGCRTKVRGSMGSLMISGLPTTISNPPGDFTPLNQS
ncbi:MAG: hypothetical protein F6K23_39225 [Okeania sp. SIO2C9]|nr:hypothetical protein [Okeania sp. SIO2C9]